MASIEVAELESLACSFPSVGVQLTRTSATVAALTLSVPHFASADEHAADAAQYHHAITATVMLGLPSASALRQSAAAPAAIREVLVATSGALSAAALDDDECGVLSHLYEATLMSSGSAADESPFTVAAPENAKLVLDSGGALFALLCQMQLDSSDGNLGGALAAQAGQRRKEQRAGSNVSDTSSVSTQQQQQSQAQRMQLDTAADPPVNVTVRVELAKVDHMNSAARYERAIASSVAAVEIPPHALETEAAVPPGLVGAVLVRDPLSPRVILGFVSVLDGPSGGDAAAGAVAADDISGGGAAATRQSSSSSPIAVSAGSAILKSLRCEIVDVDSHGRKCRERMMRALGAFDQDQVSPADLRKCVAAPWLEGGRAAQDRVLKLAPATREEGVAVLRRLLVQPLSDAAGGKRGVPAWIGVASEILDAADFWSHV